MNGYFMVVLNLSLFMLDTKINLSKYHTETSNNPYAVDSDLGHADIFTQYLDAFR